MSRRLFELRAFTLAALLSATGSTLAEPPKLEGRDAVQLTTIRSPLLAAEARADDLPIVPLRIDAPSLAALEKIDRHQPVTLTDFVLVSALGADSKLETAIVDLEPIQLFTDDVRIVDGSYLSEGGHGRALPVPEVRLYRGTIRNRPASRVFLSLSPHGVNGYVQTADGLQIISDGPAGAAGAKREPVIFDAEALPEGMIHWRDFVCGAADPPEGMMVREGGVAGGDEDGCRHVVIAVETDYEFTGWVFGGSTSAASAYVATLLGAVSEIYTNQLSTYFTVDFVRLWSTPADPWTESGSSAQLNEFRFVWNSTMGDVERHLAHFLSGRGLGGGVAWLNAVCDPSWGYGLSSGLNGFFPYPLVDHHWQNWDPIVVAHEIGHNFGSPHTHAYCPPLDQCAPPGYFGSCQSSTVCQQGTIMSYCHLCSGGTSNIALDFHPGNVQTIIDYLDSIPSGPCAVDCVPAPWGVAADPTIVCEGEPVALSASTTAGHTIHWYANDCGGELIGTGLTLDVSPATTTTYLARTYDAQTDVESDVCVAVTVVVSTSPNLLDPTVGQPGTSNAVRALTTWNGDLIVGGAFTQAGGQTVNHLARWDGTEWHPFIVDGFAIPGTSDSVEALLEWNGDLVVGGTFNSVGAGQNVYRIARWDGGSWHAFPDEGGTGAAGTVFALSALGADLVAGGSFVIGGGDTSNRIMRWTGSGWAQFVVDGAIGMDSTVRALTIWNGELIAAGQFVTAGGATVNRIARWDGAAWQPLASGGQIGVDHNVLAMVVWNGDLIAGGSFLTAGGQTVNRVARWDGASWQPFTGGGEVGVNGTVRAMTVWNDDLVIGGDFTTAGGQTVDRLARWDGTNWSPFEIGGDIGADNSVRALTPWEGDVIAGGDFSLTADIPASHIARWSACPFEPECGVADVNCDGAVDGDDLAILLGQWGPCAGCAADLNDDGHVDGADLASVLGSWAP